MNVRDALLEWMDRFEDGHYVLDLYGKSVSVDLDRMTVEKVMDIAISLVDQVVAAKGEVTSAEYERLEEEVRGMYPEDEKWLFHTILKVVQNEHLFGRYRDIEPMIGELEPRGFPVGSVSYLLLLRMEMHMLIYSVIRNVDDVEENYDSWVYSFFLGVLAKGWGEGFGWSKAEDGSWVWENHTIHRLALL